MIARIAVHLPEWLWLAQSAQFEPFAVQFGADRVVVHPPAQSGFEVRPDQDGTFDVDDLYRMLTPVKQQRVDPFVRMDGEPVKHANLLLWVPEILAH
jgi:hypothetical protein